MNYELTTENNILALLNSRYRHIDNAVIILNNHNITIDDFVDFCRLFIDVSEECNVDTSDQYSDAYNMEYLSNTLIEYMNSNNNNSMREYIKNIIMGDANA